MHKFIADALHESCDIQIPSPAKGKIVYSDDCAKVKQIMDKSTLSSDDAECINSRLRGESNNKYLVCCEIDPAGTTSTTTTRTTYVDPVSKVFPTAAGCGSFYGDRIIGGNNTQVDEFPWAALIQYTYRKYYLFD